MFKLLIALSLFIAIQCQPIDTFEERTDLLQSPITESMVKLAIKQLAEKENLQLSPIKVLDVSSQLVNGINYRVIFTAMPASSIGFNVCIARAYQPFTGEPTISSVKCA